ncbi:phosphatidylglycerophosphate synthase-like, putative [Bodo saltans]|uniref:CDP-diacylglycerol--glycerol-3-phosphate 3-phosphatidyltransferase n=1 Tax=Bodo saltans TaxID=75058 RepID=A0A0S4JQL9_BODSA|nr:phosphatidylglycerophosphate synthase-like, putative [Bodo saltans]|eukprot:CUG92486.1 phosphatidylglycerophosphate synthase-like, putative [Bodo saltans]
MLTILALCATMALIWLVAKYLFSEGPIDSRGGLYFRSASASYTPLECRHNADPRARNAFDEEATRTETTPAIETVDVLQALTQELIKKTRDVAHSDVEQQHQHAIADPLVSILSSTCCVIPATAANIQVLATPNEFYETLKAKIRAAQHRVMISALYVGDGPLSKAFLQTLEDKVREFGEARRAERTMCSFPGSHADVTSSQAPFLTPVPSTDELLGDYANKFTIEIVLDYNRMHDRKNMMTIRALAEAASQYKNEVEVRLHLFQTPSSLNRFLGPFGRSKELLGVQHTKLFAFDDEDVLLTGANLSDDYFQNRMDRYLVVKNTPQLAEWVRGALDCLISLSHRVVYALEDAIPSDVLPTSEIWTPSPSPQKASSPNASRGPSRTASTDSLNGLKTAAASTPHTTHTKSKLIILPATCGVDATRDHVAFREVAREQFDLFAAEMYDSSLQRLRFLLSRSATCERKEVDTLLFPTLQFGRVNIHHDVNVVQEVLRGVTSGMRVCLTSPYLNMYHSFTDAVLKSKATFDFITASLTSNGWSGQKGFAGQIPFYYFQLERSFYFLMESFGCSNRVHIREFTAPGMTFHAKGMWILSQPSTMPHPASTTTDKASAAQLPRQHESDDDRAVVGVPVIAAYGSTNYGNRSIHKDVEVESFLYTWGPSLQEQMRLELQRLLTQSELATRDRFVGGKHGRFQPVVALVAALGQDYM